MNSGTNILDVLTGNAKPQVDFNVIVDDASYNAALFRTAAALLFVGLFLIVANQVIKRFI